MGLLDGLKRGAITTEIKRLLQVYQPTLAQWGITIQEEQFIYEVLRLYEAKGREEGVPRVT